MSIETSTTASAKASTSRITETPFAITDVKNKQDDDDDQIEISRNLPPNHRDNRCDHPILQDLNRTDIFTESDKVNNNDKNKEEEIIVGSFQNKLSIQSNELNTRTRSSSDWDLKAFLNESALQRNDIDVLIMSEAGKPIYCYSGRKDDTTLVGVCVALVNYVIKTQNDQLRTIRTRNGLNIHFAVRSPLVIVVVCRQITCFDEKILISQIHAQIISTITLKKLKFIFQQAPTYDLKRIIHKNDFKTLDILVKSITTPITDLFPTYKKNKYKLSGQIFNNVISFYTSVSMPRSLPIQPSSAGNSSLNNSSSMIFMQDHKPSVLSRVYVPIAIMNSGLREQITTIINQSVIINSDIVFSILFHIEDDYNDDIVGSSSFQENFPNEFQSNFEWNRFNHMTSSDDDDDNVSSTNEFYESFESSQAQRESQDVGTAQQQQQPDKISHYVQTPLATLKNSKISKNLKLISVCNHTTKFRINPLDIQLLYALIKASDSLLTSTESLWIPLCLSQVDVNRFLHAHVSYLSKKYCLILLDVDHNNFEKCRQVKETINFKLDQIRLTEPMTGLQSNITELGQPHLQYLCYKTLRHCIVWQASIQTEFSPLNYYLIDRMQRSSLKTLWLRSMKEQCALLGWQTATFQLYAQFDGFVTKQSALETVTLFIKWFKKEEDKFIIKDN